MGSIAWFVRWGICLGAFLTPVAIVATDVRQEAAARHPLDPALELLEICRDRFAAVFDYEARLVRQERSGRRLLPAEDIQAKFRQQPLGVYLRWTEPRAGQEAIYGDGLHDGKVVMHMPSARGDVARAGERESNTTAPVSESTEKIRETGIGFLLDRYVTLWAYKQQFANTEVEICGVKLNGRSCYMISVVHPVPDDGTFLFHTVRLYIDKEYMLPIRVENFGYPARAGHKPGELLESQTYLELRLNPGLKEIDFSIANPEYGFTRMLRPRPSTDW